MGLWEWYTGQERPIGRDAVEQSLWNDLVARYPEIANDKYAMELWHDANFELSDVAAMQLARGEAYIYFDNNYDIADFLEFFDWEEYREWYDGEG